MSSFRTFWTHHQSTAAAFVLPHGKGHLLQSHSSLQRRCTTCNTHTHTHTHTVCTMLNPPPQNSLSPQQKQYLSLNFLLSNSLYTLQTTHCTKLEHYLKGPDIMLIIVRLKKEKQNELMERSFDGTFIWWNVHLMTEGNTAFCWCHVTGMEEEGCHLFHKWTGKFWYISTMFSTCNSVKR